MIHLRVYAYCDHLACMSSSVHKVEIDTKHSPVVTIQLFIPEGWKIIDDRLVCQKHVWHD